MTQNITIGNVKKLVPNFFDKEKFVLHYENLKLYLRLGIKLKSFVGYQSEYNWTRTQYHFVNNTQLVWLNVVVGWSPVATT